MTWLGVIGAALTALGAFAGWLRNRQLMAAGHDAAMAGDLKAASDESAAAKAARDSVRVALEREPLRLRDDDGFKRSD
jgi:hypothetical protein